MAQEWVTNQRVQYFSDGQKQWYPGSVKAVDAHGNIDVKLDFGGEKKVPANEVARRLKKDALMGYGIEASPQEGADCVKVQDASGCQVTVSLILFLLVVPLAIIVYVNFFPWKWPYNGRSRARLADAYRMLFTLFGVWLWKLIVQQARERLQNLRTVVSWERQERLRKLLLIIDFYSILYLFFFWEVGQNCYETWLHTYSGTAALSPSYVFEHSNRTATNAQGVVNTTLRDMILKEVSVEGFWLRRLPLGTPVAAGLTLLVSFAATLNHVLAMWNQNKGEEDKWQTCHFRHTSVIQINTLPLVYGVMALKSVMRTWEVVGSTYSWNPYFPLGSEALWVHGKDTMLALSDGNFAFADVYEAWSLVAFGTLTFSLIKEVIQDRTFAETEGKETSGKHKKKAKTVETLLGALESLALTGIQSFYVSCFLSSLFELAMIWAHFYRIDIPGLPLATQAQVSKFLLGFGFLASYLAINNIMTIESKFEEELDYKDEEHEENNVEFEIFWKFVSTKILVSLAFFQDIILVILKRVCHYSETQSNLLYSTLLCYECLLVGILGMWAWGSSQQWYRNQKVKARESDCAKQPLLEGA